MSFTQSLLYYIPTALLGIIMVVSTIVISVFGLFLVRLIIPRNEMKKHNDVAGAIFATVGVTYAVILAFMVIVTWQSFDNSKQDVAKEANNIANLYRDSTVFPETFKREIRIALKNYVNEIINDEWPLMARGERSPRVQDAQEKMWRLYTSFKPAAENEKRGTKEAFVRSRTGSQWDRL